ncbi:MAG: threonine/serine dehydratase [Acidimicrobiia bacterium]|nr:threonine/serine dehydratase [Acidimicrobiia bacterium]
MAGPAATFSEVREAATRIEPFVHRTPVATSATLRRETGAEVFFKCENLQKVGAFKARGALNAVLTLDDAAAQRGVITHSSGNHGAALAYAASIGEIPCTVVMPDHAPQVKIDAVRGYGATIEMCKHSERETATAALIEQTGATLVHPYNDRAIIAGQGTAALELIEDAGDLDVIITPVGGGGLMSGTAITTRHLLPDAWIIGAEPRAVDDAYRSLASGELQPQVTNPTTVADGLLTGLGDLTFSTLVWAGVEIALVGEEAIIAAALFHLHRMKILVEPSGATGLAALRSVADAMAGKRIGIIISGGNTDLSWLPAPG